MNHVFGRFRTKKAPVKKTGAYQSIQSLRDEPVCPRAPTQERTCRDCWTFFHPDCTVGPGVSPDHAKYFDFTWLAGFTADRELVASNLHLTLPRRFKVFFAKLYQEISGLGWFEAARSVNQKMDSNLIQFHHYSHIPNAYVF